MEHLNQEERIRKALVDIINNNPVEREQIEAELGKGNVWDSKELQENFEVLAFAAPFCVVKRKKDGKEGSVMFQHHPRYYFSFIENE